MVQLKKAGSGRPDRRVYMYIPIFHHESSMYNPQVNPYVTRDPTNQWTPNDHVVEACLPEHGGLGFTGTPTLYQYPQMLNTTVGAHWFKSGNVKGKLARGFS
jgi:hypothetical protein